MSKNPPETLFNHGGNIFRYARHALDEGSKIIDFSANINPVGLSGKAVKILKNPEKIKFLIENYPDVYPERFADALSDFHKIDKKFIFAGAGATELIFNAVNILKPGTVFIAEPSFSEYERASAIANSNIIHIDTFISENFEFKEKSLLRFFKNIKKISKNDLFFIASPSNPAGTILHKDILIEILKALKQRNAFLILDESFMDFCEEFSAKFIIPDFDNLIIIRSMTKFFAMPGQRLGYIFAVPKIIKKFAETVMPWKITSLGAAIAVASLKDGNYVLKTLNLLNNLKKDLLTEFEKLKLFKIMPGRANFFLIKIKTNLFNSNDLKNYLLKSRILIRSCSDYRGLSDKYFRIAVRKKAENDLLIEKLKKFISAV